MIEVTISDLKRAVIYRPPGGTAERGVITGFNDSVVFVRYGHDANSKATLRRDLEYEEGGSK